MYCWEDVVRSNALEALREAVALGLATSGERQEPYDAQQQAPTTEASPGIADLIQRLIGKERSRHSDQGIGDDAAAVAAAQIEQHRQQQQQQPQQQQHQQHEKSVIEVFCSTAEEMLRGYLDDSRLLELQDAVQGLYKQAELYCKAPPYSPQQAEILTRLLTLIETELQPRIFSNEGASSSADENAAAPAKVLPYLVAVGTLHLAAIRERLVYCKQLYGDNITDEDVQRHRLELLQAVDQYNAAADAAYASIQAWRQSHFSFLENQVNQKPPHKNAATTYRYVYTASDSFSGWSYESSYSTTVLWAFRTVTGDPKAEQKVQQALQNHRQEAAKQLGECLAQALAPLRLWQGCGVQQGRQGMPYRSRCNLMPSPTTAAAVNPAANSIGVASWTSSENADDTSRPIDGVSVSVPLGGDVPGAVVGASSSIELVMNAPIAEAPRPECHLGRTATGSDSAATGELAATATCATATDATTTGTLDDDVSSSSAGVTATGAADSASDPAAVHGEGENASAAEDQEGGVYKAFDWEDYFPTTLKVAITVAFGTITVVQLYRLLRQNHMM